MKYTSLFLLCLGFTVATSQEKFPSIKGVALDDKVIYVPNANKKPTIVGVAFHRNAEDALKSWLQPLYDTFIKDPEGGGDFDIAEIYDVNFVFIPVISGFSKAADDFKKGTDQKFWPYIVDIGRTDVKDLKSSLKVEDTKEPYFYALSPEGKILSVVSGRYSKSKLGKLESTIE